MYFKKMLRIIYNNSAFKRIEEVVLLTKTDTIQGLVNTKISLVSMKNSKLVLFVKCEHACLSLLLVCCSNTGTLEIEKLSNTFCSVA